MKSHKVFTGAMKSKTLPFMGKDRKVPSLHTVFKWQRLNMGQATDGCRVANGDQCAHGHRSWVAELGYC